MRRIDAQVDAPARVVERDELLGRIAKRLAVAEDRVRGEEGDERGGFDHRDRGRRGGGSHLGGRGRKRAEARQQGGQDEGQGAEAALQGGVGSGRSEDAADSTRSGRNMG